MALARTLIKVAILTSTNVFQRSIIPVTIFCLQCRLYLIFACLAGTVSDIAFKALESNLGKSLCTGVIPSVTAYVQDSSSKVKGNHNLHRLHPGLCLGLILCLSGKQVISLFHLTCFYHSKGQMLRNVQRDMIGEWKT